jgi:hypothetical protein
MKRLLMFLYLVLVMIEARPKRGWRLFTRRRRPDSLLTFAESGFGTKTLPGIRAGARPSPTTRPTGMMDNRRSIRGPGTKPVPTTLVEKEKAAALRLAMPPIKRVGDFVHIQSGVERYDTPIGRTLTRERMMRDWRHVPRVAMSHLPIDDVSRLVAMGAITTPQPTSPRARGTEKKGRATPKRPRRNHGA